MAYGNMSVEYAVGSGPGLTDVMNWTMAPSDNCIIIPSSDLVGVTKYYISLRGKSFNGLFSQVSKTDGGTYLIPDNDQDGDGHNNQSEITRVLHYDGSNGRYEEAGYLPGNLLTGINFLNKNGEAYIIYSKVEKVVTFTSKVCPAWDLLPGLNLFNWPEFCCIIL